MVQNKSLDSRQASMVLSSGKGGFCGGGVQGQDSRVAYGFTRRGRASPRAAQETETQAYGFQRLGNVRAATSSPEMRDCLGNGDGRGSSKGRDVRTAKTLADADLAANDGFRRRSDNSRRVASPSAKVGFAARDNEYGLGRIRRISSPGGSCTRDKSEPPEKTRQVHDSPRQMSGVMKWGSGEPTATRPSRAEVLHRETSSSHFDGPRKPPLPPEASATAPASPLTLGWRMRRSRSASEMSQSRRSSRGPRSESGCSDRSRCSGPSATSSGRQWLSSLRRSSRSPSVSGDPLKGLCFDGTSEGGWTSDGPRGSLWSDLSQHRASLSPQRRCGQVRDEHLDGGLPSGIGHGKRSFHKEVVSSHFTNMGTAEDGVRLRRRDRSPSRGRDASPSACSSPGRDWRNGGGSSCGTSRTSEFAAGQRNKRADPMLRNSTNGDFGRRHFETVSGEDHFIDSGVAAGGTKLYGCSHTDTIEGGLPRGIGSGKRAAPAKYLDHFVSHGHVAPYLNCAGHTRGTNAENASEYSGGWAASTAPSESDIDSRASVWPWRDTTTTSRAFHYNGRSLAEASPERERVDTPRAAQLRQEALHDGRAHAAAESKAAARKKSPRPLRSVVSAPSQSVPPLNLASLEEPLPKRSGGGGNHRAKSPGASASLNKGARWNP
eukprot:TRINITY_DN15320_c0_g1_i1.p1 TRINITY_DN15320_c0_g1~~TRINITY_DN15320_c0_g1_i1.p1  ORF type:complete len:681 (+),score=87.78 TRINITY_DN15320_c0_g1_i1:61-2043(+)